MCHLILQVPYIDAEILAHAEQQARPNFFFRVLDSSECGAEVKTAVAAFAASSNKAHLATSAFGELLHLPQEFGSRHDGSIAQ